VRAAGGDPGALAVEGLTSPTMASSVLVRAGPSSRQYSMRARAGSAMAAAMPAAPASGLMGLPLILEPGREKLAGDSI
jgi:hypothetical protein